MQRPRRFILAVLLALVVGASILIPLLREPIVEPEDLVITTGTPGGTYIVVGAQLARILETYPDDSIGNVRSQTSAGSLENIDRLLNGEADIALSVGPVLAGHPARGDLRALIALYSDVWQVVVRRDASIEGLRDMRGKRIFVGAEQSGTRWGATRILQAGAGLGDTDYQKAGGRTYSEAARALVSGSADAAFFVTATPAIAVTAALESGCCKLLSFRENFETVMASVPGLSKRTIPAHLYESQSEPVETFGATAILFAHKRLRNDVVLGVLNALFDHMGDLAVAHIRVQDVRLGEAFSALPKSVQIHPGALEFAEREKRKLQIATGVINGKYYDLGKRIQLILEKEGIPSRAIHTDGSLENMRLLQDRSRPTIALVQYDTALASIWSSSLYQTPVVAETLTIPHISGLRRIATLHEESVHALILRDRIPKEPRRRPTLAVLQGKRVCLGPEHSGTQVLARVLLERHHVKPRESLYLSVPDMVARIYSGEIDAGFFMSHVPGEALKTIVHDDRNRLLSIDPGKVAGILGPSLGITQIEPGTYGAQRPDEPAIDTIATRAVLVSTDQLPFDVHGITRALFKGAAFLGVEDGPEGMAQTLPSLPLHRSAEAYYREAGYLPSPEQVDWLTVTWRSLAILVMVVGGYQGVLKLRRDRTANAVGRRILGISVDASEPGAVGRLLEIRDVEIRERVQRRWWRGGELDKGRWQYLHDLTNVRITQAKENLTAALAEDLRKLASEVSLDSPAGQARLRALEERVWGYFNRGELDATHQSLLLEVVQKLLSEPGPPEASGPAVSTTS